jgi:hypothetical protein
MHVFIISTAHSLVVFGSLISFSQSSRVDFCRVILSNERTLKKKRWELATYSCVCWFADLARFELPSGVNQ